MMRDPFVLTAIAYYVIYLVWRAGIDDHRA